MARDQKRRAQDVEVSVAPPHAASSATTANVSRIEAAMSKIARALPANPSLGLVWARLEDMHRQATTRRQDETEAQASARAWLAAQNEISANKAAVSASDKPTP